MENLLTLASVLSWPGAIAVSIIVLYKGGVVTAIASWIKKTTPDGRLDNLEAFKFKAETNHFHDLENVMKELTALEDKVERFHAEIYQRIAIVETKVNVVLNEGKREI